MIEDGDDEDRNVIEYENDQIRRIAYGLKQGDDVNQELHRDWSRRIVRFLLSKGADINTRNECERTPLLSAASVSNYKTVEFFIERGCDLFAVDKWGNNALDVIRWELGHPENRPILCLLLRHGLKSEDRYACVDMEAYDILVYDTLLSLIVLCAPNHCPRATKRPWLQRDTLIRLKAYLL